jgi:hypothetical protein
VERETLLERTGELDRLASTYDVDPAEISGGRTTPIQN